MTRESLYIPAGEASKQLLEAVLGAVPSGMYPNARIGAVEIFVEHSGPLVDCHPERMTSEELAFR